MTNNNNNLTDKEITELWVNGELVLDDKPRRYTEEEKQKLKDWFDSVVDSSNWLNQYDINIETNE